MDKVLTTEELRDSEAGIVPESLPTQLRSIDSLSAEEKQAVHEANQVGAWCYVPVRVGSSAYSLAIAFIGVVGYFPTDHITVLTDDLAARWADQENAQRGRSAEHIWECLTNDGADDASDNQEPE